MTCAIRPQPTTPTLILPAIRTPFTECVGTFHRPYTNDLSVSTLKTADRRGEYACRLRHARFGGDERVFVLDGDRVDAAARRQPADETVPPGLRLAPTDHREVPRHLVGRFRPAPVEKPIDREVVLRDHHILSVAVSGAIADAIDDRNGIHSHPEEVARVNVGGDRIPQARDPVEGLDVVNDRPGVKLQAHEQLRLLVGPEPGASEPAWFHRRLTLRVMNALEIGEPAAAGEMRRAVAWGAGRTARQRDDAVHSEHGRE